jgi:hypothetical protein
VKIEGSEGLKVRSVREKKIIPATNSIIVISLLRFFLEGSSWVLFNDLSINCLK